MRSFLTKGWILFMLVILGVGLVGIGYTFWTKQMQVEGVVALDDVDIAFVKAYTDDNHAVESAKDTQDTTLCEPDQNNNGGDPVSGADDDNPGCDPAAAGMDPKLRYDKDIATCSAAIDTASTGEKISIHVINGYPSYYCTAWFDLENVGSIPVKLQRVILQGADIDPSVWYPLDLDQNGEDDLEVHFTGLDIDQQLDAGDGEQGDVQIHILDGAPQKKAVSFELEMIWRQYNQNAP